MDGNNAYREALRAVIRELRRRGDEALADQVDSLVADLRSIELRRMVPLPADGGLVSADVVAARSRERLAAFERTVRRSGPKAGPERIVERQVDTIEGFFKRMLERNPGPSRPTWERVCRRLWRDPLQQTRPVPGHVIDAVVTGRTALSRALQLVAASQGGTADPESLRRRIARRRS